MIEASPVSFKRAFGQRDFFLLTIDALRYDVARDALAAGELPNLAALLPGGFEARHTPATFTYPAHQAFFAGFLPTPLGPGPHRRPIALRFAGSKTTDRETLLLDGPDLVTAFAKAGYRTICIGGTTFFNPASEVGAVLPRLFDEAHWTRAMGVSSPHASREQLGLAAARLGALPLERRAFLFVNLAATHPPTRLYLKSEKAESRASQAAALRDVDRHLPTLVQAFRARGGAVGIVCSDHGTCFGGPEDDGHVGHRLAHPSVWTVPYAETEISTG